MFLSINRGARDDFARRILHFKYLGRTWHILLEDIINIIHVGSTILASIKEDMHGDVKIGYIIVGVTTLTCITKTHTHTRESSITHTDQDTN